MAVPMTWLMNMDLGEASAVETMLIMTPQAARLAMTPPAPAPAHAPITKMASFP
ncbi:unnamed protein product [Spirodela intermedia]|uniref:Uncharacterized protein n=1 Tax=Spirodela intermedia TaxID=51605 RepID=A0A7I8K4I4_SPIIN|nr:unnamed protein product [Spirodela intermedia]